MEFHDLNAPPYVEQSVFPFADLQCDDAVDRPSSEFAAPIDFSSNVDGRYQMNHSSFFDTEYINPALLEAHNPAAVNNVLNDYYSPTMQNTQNGLSTYHPEWHTLPTDFEEQQQNFQSQDGIHDGAFPNALEASPHDRTSFDWPGTWQGEQGGQPSLASSDHIADKPTGRLDFSHGDHFGAFRKLESLSSTATSANRTPMHCEWPACKKESFRNEEHFAQHLYHHRDEARHNFVVPGACQWPGCRSERSGVTFRTRADFDRHLKRHMKIHWCDVPGCKHREGFARHYDLTRHLKCHSTEREFNCPDSSCNSAYLGFLRKDKLDDHIKTRHPHLMNIVESHRCDVHGCTIKRPFDSIEDLKKHFAASHEINRPHRCPVKSCARYNNGFTTSAKLIEHIKVEHDPPKCKFDHCDFRSLGEVMDKHHQRAHWVGVYPLIRECNLPGCEGSRSSFSFERFRTHLAEHGFPTSSFQLIDAAVKGDMSYFDDSKFVPCKSCSG